MIVHLQNGENMPKKDQLKLNLKKNCLTRSLGPKMNLKMSGIPSKMSEMTFKNALSDSKMS